MRASPPRRLYPPPLLPSCCTRLALGCTCFCHLLLCCANYGTWYVDVPFMSRSCPVDSQEFNTRKKLESGLRRTIHSANEISAVGPGRYAKRFVDFMSRVFS